MLLIIIHGVVDERVVHQAAPLQEMKPSEPPSILCLIAIRKSGKALFAPPAAKRRYLSYSRLPTGPLPQIFSRTDLPPQESNRQTLASNM